MVKTKKILRAGDVATQITKRNAGKAGEVRSGELTTIAEAVAAAAKALALLRDAPANYSMRYERPFTEVSQEVQAGVDSILRFGLSVAYTTQPHRGADVDRTVEAVEPLLRAALDYLLAPNQAVGGRLRKAAAVFHGYNPSRNQVAKLVTLGKAVQQALHPSLAGVREGEADWIARTLLPTLGATRSVDTAFILELLDSWAPKSTQGKRAVSGIVAELMCTSGIEKRRLSPELRKSVSTLLTKARITNTPTLHFRADGSLPGRSWAVGFELPEFMRPR